MICRFFGSVCRGGGCRATGWPEEPDNPTGDCQNECPKRADPQLMQGLLIEAEENERAVNHGHSEGDGGSVAFLGTVLGPKQPQAAEAEQESEEAFAHHALLVVHGQSFNAQRILFAAEHLGEGKGAPLASFGELHGTHANGFSTVRAAGEIIVRPKTTW